MIPPDALPGLASLLEIAFVGRVLLSFLPPGLPGRHGPADLTATWAASHLLGSLAIGIEIQLLTLAGVRLHPVALLVPWLLLALARWLTLPGAMVPRHEPLPDSPGALARIFFIAATLAPAVGAVLGERDLDYGTLVSVADALALLALCNFGLSAARRSPPGRAVCVLAIAIVLATALASSHVGLIHLALLTGSGTATMVPWLRRGDRRAAALAGIAFAGTALLGPREALLGAAGLFALWLHTAASSQKHLALFTAAVFAPCAALGWLAAGGAGAPPPFATRSEAAVAFVVALALSARKRLVDARNRRREPQVVSLGSVDSTRPQSDALRDAIVLCFFLLVSRGELAALASLPTIFLPLAPMIAVELGLLLAPSERPFAETRRAGALVEPSSASLRR